MSRHAHLRLLAATRNALLILGFCVSSLCFSDPILYKKASKSIVVVFAGDGLGSGVLLSPTIVATNCHVVGDLKVVEVEFFGAKQSANVVGRNDTQDVCILSIVRSFPNSAPVPGVRFIKDIDVGETVYALGAPAGLTYTITSGIVSQLREFRGGTVVQFDAATSNGNSGGGLFDSRGNLLGLPSFVRAASPLENKSYQNLNFAWSVDVFPAPADKLAANLRISTGPVQKQGAAQKNDPTFARPKQQVISSEFERRWDEAFQSKNFKQAAEISTLWIKSETLNPAAYVARGRAKEAMALGAGIGDFVEALKLNHSHQPALYFAAISSNANGEKSAALRYKQRLQTLNPQLAEKL
jgi:S1-C subfamily serine protease